MVLTKETERDRFQQVDLADFLGEKVNQSTKYYRKVHIPKTAVKEAFRLMIQNLKANSIELRELWAYIYSILLELEKEDICYLKETQNGRKRLFRKMYCISTVNNWKKCPHSKCPEWPFNEYSMCPYEKELLEVSQNVERVTV